LLREFLARDLSIARNSKLETRNSKLALKVLVTGGSGYLGTHICRFFQADDFSRRSQFNVLSISDAARIGDYDTVIHLAAHLSKDPTGADDCFRTNVEGTVNLLRQVRPNAVFIFASTKDVYGAHADAYAEVPEHCSTNYQNHSALEWSKLIAERYVEYYGAQRGFRSCIFRLAATYARPSEGNANGFVTHYVESVKRGWPIRLPLEGTPVRDVLHVNDLALACRAFIDSSVAHGLYNLGGGRANALSLREIIEKLAAMIQCTPVIDADSPVAAPVPLNYIADLTKTENELGWRPTIGVEEGLRSLL
jgi:nucleoside-diphosphate-sugar epimerase